MIKQSTLSIVTTNPTGVIHTTEKTKQPTNHVFTSSPALDPSNHGVSSSSSTNPPTYPDSFTHTNTSTTLPINSTSKLTDIQRPSGIVIGMITSNSNQKVIPVNDDNSMHGNNNDNNAASVRNVDAGISFEDIHPDPTSPSNMQHAHNHAEFDRGSVASLASDDKEGGDIERHDSYDPDGEEGNPEEEGEVTAMDMVRQMKFYRKLKRFYHNCTYDNLKLFVRWSMESATCTISFTVSLSDLILVYF